MGDHDAVTEHKTPVDHAIDLFVYAPLGFALDARELVPKLIDRGRSQVTSQMAMARMVGQFAVKQGQGQGGKYLSRVQEQAATALGELGLLPRDGSEPGAANAPAPRATPGPTRATSAKAAAGGADAIDASTLAVPDYDSLAASQVIPRLAGLTDDELEAVRAYEAGHRGRKTILNKIVQIQG